MIKNILHNKIVEHYTKVQKWFLDKSKDNFFPFYSSFDLRDSSQKIAPVDANLFPAGFNNICEIDRENAPVLCKEYLDNTGLSLQKVILLAEEHTNNPFYWDNIHSLKLLLKKSGVKSVFVCVPGKHIHEDTCFTSAQGHSIEVFLLKNQIHETNLIISNNDFSTDYDINIPVPITPPVWAGWNTRRKHSFFIEYNRLVYDFARVIDVDPDVLSIKTKRFTGFDPNNSESLQHLKEEVDVFLTDLTGIYKKYKQKPFVFLKNNSGTYGLGMTTISSVSDIENWNYKIKKKMKASKGGQKVSELIIQEGLVSSVKTEGAVAEPVIYLVGSRLVGGFLRAHKDKGVTDNLNSPGAVYRTLCVSDLEIEVSGKPMENVYGWVAYLGVLALQQEFKSTKFISD